MFVKIAACCVLILAVLWAAGFDFLAVKGELMGAANGNAESMTGQSDRLSRDWG